MAHELARVGYLMRDGLARADAAVLFRSGLRVLRPWLRSVSVSPISDDPWPQHLRGQADRLLAMARDQQPVGIIDLAGGVGIDVRDDAEFALLMVTCCYSTSVRGYTDFRVCVFEGGDTGTSLWLALTTAEHASLRTALSSGGRDLTDLLVESGSAD